MAEGDIHDDVGWGSGGDPFDTSQTTHGKQPGNGWVVPCSTIVLIIVAVFLMVMASKNGHKGKDAGKKVVFPKKKIVIVEDKK